MTSELKPVERIVIDTSVLDEMFSTLGDLRAEELVMQRVEGISNHLANVDGLLRSADLEAIIPIAQEVSVLCEDIGLVTLARVSRDLSITSGQQDPVATHAVWERLVRIGDRSLAQVWELPGLSM